MYANETAKHIGSPRVMVVLGVLRTRWLTVAMGALAVMLALGSQGARGLAEESPIGSVRAASAASVSAEEQASLQQPAAALAAQYATNLSGLAAAGNAALRAGRNDATIASLLRLRATARLNARLEHYGARLGSSQVGPLSLAVAGVQRYSELIHSALRHDAPTQVIVVSVTEQRLTAYNRGKALLDTLVTTGRPSLATDIGAMRVIEKDSPWTMHSPWPKDSPNWYPDTPVQMVLWFTKNGEGLHDASWQPPGTYGPGSPNGPYASHGCIHVPLAAVTVLFDWATVGTPVVVYPGDGEAVADQMAQVSVDGTGNPITGTRGA